MPTPASNDPTNQDAIGGASERDVRRASLMIRWLVVATLAVALAFLYLLSASAEELVGRVVSVHDGDTLTILVSRKQFKIRLLDIDAPERKQPFGTRARQSLADMCAGKEARIAWQAKDRYGRTLGRVNCLGLDANAEQVRRGMAWVFERYAPKDSFLYAVQTEAQNAKRGLWVDPRPVPPWEWRRNRR